MGRRLISLTVLGLTFTASMALASAGDPKPDRPATSAPSMPSSSSASASGSASAPRGEAEKSYAAAYEEIAAAKKDLADGKKKNADKRFKKAIEAGERATALDAQYYEAWNLVGYAARKLGDYDKAFASYEKCLAIKSDYAPAREYLGEAWLEKGDLGKAKAQLVLLQAYGETASADAKTLNDAIAAYVTAHPNDAATASAATPAAADTASKPK
jgi:tetratricopeptide (TPR) repeat protein